MNRPPKGVKNYATMLAADCPREDRIEYKGTCGCLACLYVFSWGLGFACVRLVIGELNFQVERDGATIFVGASILILFFFACGIIKSALTKHILYASNGYGYYVDEFALFNRIWHRKVWRFPLTAGTEVEVCSTQKGGSWICVSNPRKRGFAINSVELSDRFVTFGHSLPPGKVLAYFAEWIRWRI